jgi:hypothetical protein
VWLYLPNRTSSYSPAPAGSLSLSDSQCQRLAQSAMWRSTSRRPEAWRRAFEKDASMTLLSGVTCEPSTADAFVDEWLESLEDSHVPTCPSQGNAPASTGSIPGCGGSTPESFAKFNPDGSISKTSRQFSMFQQDEPYSENFPRWGLMRSGELFELPTWAPHIRENALSSWPTPVANDDNKSPEAHLAMKQRMGERDGSNGLEMQTQYWRTPTACSENSLRGSGQNAETRAAQGHTVNLQDQVSMWKTPHGMNGVDATGKYGGGGEFAKQVQGWPTPASRDYRDANAKPLSERGGESKGEQLPNFIRHHYSHPDQETPNHGAESSSNGRTSRPRLNPAFVCWLMTWPWWWTHPAPISFAPAAMALWLSKARQHLSNCAGGLD